MRVNTHTRVYVFETEWYREMRQKGSDKLASQKASLTVMHCIIYHQRVHTHTHHLKIDSWKGQRQSPVQPHTQTHVFTDTSDHTSDLWLAAAGPGLL